MSKASGESGTTLPEAGLPIVPAVTAQQTELPSVHRSARGRPGHPTHSTNMGQHHGQGTLTLDITGRALADHAGVVLLV